MNYLAGLMVIGVKGFFHSDWLRPPCSISYWPRAGSGRDGKSQQPPLHYTCELRMIWQVFLNLPRQNCHMTHPRLPGVQLLHSSSDPGQIISNCLIHYYVSHILVKSYQNNIIA
jgi:hypothetical protein